MSPTPMSPNRVKVRAGIAANPDAANKTLARYLFKKHRRAWPTFAACYSCVRRERGAAGAANRERVPGAEPPRPRAVQDAHRQWGALLPAARPNPWGLAALGAKAKWLILADAHIPFHSRSALQLALSWGKDRGATRILLNGDMLDCYSISAWQRDPELVDFEAELGAMDAFLDALAAWGAEEIVYKCGNHEHRLFRYLAAKAPDVLAAARIRARLSWDSLLNLRERGIRWVEHNVPIRCGKLLIFHGDEYQGISTPVNPARGMYLKSRECSILSHFHRPSEHTETTALGTTITTWSTGALCDLHPEYRPLNAWGHGFALLDTTGPQWKVHNKRIVLNEVM